MSNTETTNSTPVTVDVQGVLAMLKAGTSRKDINASYGLPDSVADKTIWQHPELFRKRPRKQYNVVFVNETNASTAAPVVEETRSQEQVEDAAEEIASTSTEENTASNWSSPE